MHKKPPEKKIEPRLPYQDDLALQQEQPEFVARFLAENESCTACSLSVFDQLASAISVRKEDLPCAKDGKEELEPGSSEPDKKQK